MTYRVVSTQPKWSNMVDPSVAVQHLFLSELKEPDNDVEPKMAELRVLFHLFLLNSRFLRVRDTICSGDDAEPRWRNRGDGDHICFRSTSI